MRITDESNVIARINHADCSPLFEAIVAQTYIATIWVFSDHDGSVFDVSVNKQFVGTMHEGTEYESTWTEAHCGFLEDGAARIGESVSSAYFTDYSEALDHLIGETKRLTTEIFGGLDPVSLQV